MIKGRDLNMIYMTGPGHGGPGIVANTYLEGTYSELYPEYFSGRRRHAKTVQTVLISWGHFESYAPETPGSIHEGGELGYALSHAYGAAFDNPDLIVAVCRRRRRSRNGSPRDRWHSNKFFNPIHDGAVLPILHLNGYKIANPTVLARISPEELGEPIHRLRL